MSYYCVLRQRNPDTNPGYIPCPDYETRNCEGCATPDELFGDSKHQHRHPYGNMARLAETGGDNKRQLNNT